MNERDMVVVVERYDRLKVGMVGVVVHVDKGGVICRFAGWRHGTKGLGYDEDGKTYDGNEMCYIPLWAIVSIARLVEVWQTWEAIKIILRSPEMVAWLKSKVE